MALDPYRSWGYEPVAKLRGYKPAWSEDVFLSGDDLQGDKSLGNSQGNSRGSSWLPFGNGRSYGDSCLNQTGTLIDSRALDRFIAFDQETGLLTAEPGVTLASILKLIVPLGWSCRSVPVPVLSRSVVRLPMMFMARITIVMGHSVVTFLVFPCSEVPANSLNVQHKRMWICTERRLVVWD